MDGSRNTVTKKLVRNGETGNDLCNSVGVLENVCVSSGNGSGVGESQKHVGPRGCWTLCSAATKKRDRRKVVIPAGQIGCKVHSEDSLNNKTCSMSTAAFTRFWSKRWNKQNHQRTTEENQSEGYVNSAQSCPFTQPIGTTFSWKPKFSDNSNRLFEDTPLEKTTCSPKSLELPRISPVNTVSQDKNALLSEPSDDLQTIVKAGGFTGTTSVAIQCIENFNGPRDKQTNDPQLRCAIEHCERRLERLYGRLMWLRNLTLTKLPNEDLPANSLWSPRLSKVGFIDRCSGVPPPIRPPLQTRLYQPTDGQHDQCDSLSIKKKINGISKRLRQLKCQLESFTYLSWLGLVNEPPTAQVAVPGRRHPKPNPQLHVIRRPDSECRATIEEFRQLCSTPMPDGTRMALRKATFNNWPWSDAWLIRFVRQMFVDLTLVDYFNIQLSRLDIWLCDVYRCYNRVPFHNYKHAFMVTQMAYSIIWGVNLTELLDKEDQLILLVATVCHDLDHPGFNNAYQINAGTELAIRYNDQSPLENHHAAMAFEILNRHEANPFSHFNAQLYSRLREGVIRCILATDMSRHNDILTQFATVVLDDLESSQALDERRQRPMWCVDKARLDLVMMILIKVCDISNEARPLTVSREWINRLLAEFFHQSDYEKLAGLPVAPFMDRDKVTKSASQCGFIRFVILPLFEAIAKLLPTLKTVIVKPVIVQLDYYTDVQEMGEEESLGNDDKDFDISIDDR